MNYYDYQALKTGNVSQLRPEYINAAYPFHAPIRLSTRWDDATENRNKA